MSTDIDLSKPLTDEQVAELKSRHPLEYVDRLVALSQGSEFSGEQAGSDAQGNSLPEGEPTDKWKVDQIVAYAESKGVSLDGVAKKKADLLQAIEDGAPAPDGDGDETVQYAVHLSGDKDNVLVGIPADTEEDEIAATVKAAALEAGVDEGELTGYSLVEAEAATD